MRSTHVKCGPERCACSVRARAKGARSGRDRRIGKESDRRWEEGDDFESLQRRPVEYEPTKLKATSVGQSQASETLIRQIKKIGVRELMRLERRVARWTESVGENL